MNTTFLSVIYFIAFSHAVMLAIALWTRSNKGQPGRLLALVLAVLGYKLFEGGASFSGLYHYIPHALDLMPAMVMVLGPLFYGYIRHTTGQKKITPLGWLLHLTPWLVFWLSFNTPFVFRAGNEKIAMWNHIIAAKGQYSILPLEIVLRILAIKIHLTIYLILSCISLHIFTKTTQNLRSDNSSNVVSQLRFLAAAFILLEALWVSLFIAHQYFGVGTLSQVSQVWLLFIGVIVIAMGFTGLQKPDMMFTPEERSVASCSASVQIVAQDSNDSDNVKYIHSLLPESAADDIAQQIESVLEQKQLYLNDKLTLTELSKALDIKSHTVSQVINQRMQTNFYKLVNSFRIQHAIGLLENPETNWPIERIALESGFSNRVTFNKAFKDKMDCTASEFKRRRKAAAC